MEYYLTACGTGAGWQTLCDNFGFLQSVLVEYGVKQFVEFLGLAAHNGFLLGDDAFAHEIHGNLDHGSAGALAVTGLQEPQLAFLNGKFHILHITIVGLQFGLYGKKFLIEFGHHLFH